MSRDRDETQLNFEFHSSHLFSLATVEAFFENAWTRRSFIYAQDLATKFKDDSNPFVDEASLAVFNCRTGRPRPRFKGFELWFLLPA